MVLSTERHSLLTQLIRQSQRWANGRGYDNARAAELRRRLLLMNHDHYRVSIPAYQKLCTEESVGALEDLDVLKTRLMSTDDLFKSYNSRWLDDGNFTKMNAWLGQIHHSRVTTDVRDVAGVDGWVTRLEGDGIRLVYSSGTSGKFSFIPRDTEHLDVQKRATAAYLAPLLLRKVGAGWANFLLALAMQWFSLDTLAISTGLYKTKRYDALFLDFRNGRTGMQMVGQEAAAMFRNAYYLYESELNAAALRAASRGVTTVEELALVDALRDETVYRQEDNFARVVEDIKRSTAGGQRLFIFGAPFQLKSLAEYIHHKGVVVRPRAGSLLFFGGGWKAFSGEQIARDALVSSVGEALGLAPEQIIEGYSMVELNVMNVRCDFGRFHIPPLVEPVLFDEELLPKRTLDGDGIFGFLDPLASAYPGFLITGDWVHMVSGECRCGLAGPAIVEVGRVAGRELKGCAGVMAAVRA